MVALLAARRRRRWRRAVARHRRLLAAGLLGVAVAAALHARVPVAPPTEQVLVAARDLPAGRTVLPGDTVWQAWLPGTAPGGAQTAVTGRVLASAVRTGEPITDARLAGPGLLTGQPSGTRAVTVRLADPSGAWLVRPGDRVDVLAASAQGAAPGPGYGVASGPDPARSASGTGRADPVEVVVESAVVLSSPAGCAEAATGGGPLDALAGQAGAPAGCPDGLGAGSGAGTGSGSGVLVLAVDGTGARRLAVAVVDRSLSVAIRR